MLRHLLPATLLIATATPAKAVEEPSVVRGRKLAAAFLRGDVAPVWKTMSAEMRAAMGSLDALAAFRTQVDRDFGSEAVVLAERIELAGTSTVYLRIARWTKTAAAVILQWTFDPQGRISGFFVRQAPQPAASRFLDYQTKIRLGLPFDGAWFVFWGGRTLDDNYHAVDPGQRFASDFLIRREGASHRADPKLLASYYCWDQPILAPAAGRIVVARDGLPDQPIGARDLAQPAGNHVVIDFGEGEYGFLAHLRLGSLTVREGEQVQAGQIVGRCGNSGNSSEPHLHFHLQTSPTLGTGEGLPAQFLGYRADQMTVRRGEPLRGQTVSPLGETD